MWTFNHNSLRTFRRERGLKQADVAKVLKVTASCVSNYENGDTTISAAHLATLANYYGIEINDFFFKQKGTNRCAKS